MISLTSAWRSSRVVRTREKFSFVFGVMSILLSALLFGLYPTYVLISIDTIRSNAEQLGSCRVHRSGGVPPSHARLLIQEASVALFPIRPLLLCQHHELYLDLGPSAVSRVVRCMLLPFTRLRRHSYRYMALGHGVP